MSTLIDTSAFYAILDRDDANHLPARTIWFRLLDTSEPMFTHNYILLESFAILQNRLGMDAVRTFLGDMLPLLTVAWVEREIHSRAISAFLAGARRRLSLTDCVSFEILRDAVSRSVFAFDPHFSEQGFLLLKP